MKWSLFALCIGFCIDLLIGDPHGLPHPVAAIGHLISLLERLFRRLFPKTPGGEPGRRSLYLDPDGTDRCGPSGAAPLGLRARERLAAAGGGERDVRTDPRGEVAAGREHEGLCGAEAWESGRGQTGRVHDRRTRRGAAGCARRDARGGGDRGGEHVGRRDRANAVSGDRRRAARFFLQGREHDGFDAWLCGAAVQGHRTCARAGWTMCSILSPRGCRRC